MAEPVAIVLGGHRCRLKWHRGRRHADDIAFSPARIEQGLAAGASVEIDLNPLACGGWAVLHDATLDRETTGTGPVAGLGADELARLRLRANDGTPSDLQVATLADLSQALAGRIGAGGLLQLDLKVGAEALSAANIAGFAAAVGPMAGQMILSGGDAAAVLRLARQSGVAVGFDPCHEAASLDLMRRGQFDSFVDDALTAMPEAQIIYLERHLVDFAEARGVNLIAPFRAAGREVDVYTFRDAGSGSLDGIRRAAALGADQVTTDDPAAVAAALAA
ncbi:MAG: glycerophosphodiester phosphodiesterase [Rubellimicrobium sp.]|nr:glycerophosphodiester phosphodiesterase [Rubellimicrobium sp.]